MMESMIINILLMCVEVNDVVNVVFDGVDVVMFLGEIFVGKYLVEVICMMVNIVKEMEKFEGIYYWE